ncbi:hypothetical protein RHSIM_RhsimUnG0012300 [Rhododendron simsii]|uniref:alcohol dehydrogenase n=1 Tax=Rhododendron simsii TaxID=118357 RepID=A0A834FWB4_RHOSS|nr:hypothetical protein RHSIM_RhsimUnG0012300 [Rhododendron simsii]
MCSLIMPAFCHFWFAASVAWEEGKPLVIKEVEVTPPQKMEVRVKILFNTFCLTDVYFWEAKDVMNTTVVDGEWTCNYYELVTPEHSASHMGYSFNYAVSILQGKNPLFPRILGHEAGG